MTDNVFLFDDRKQKIRQVIGKYGEENFYISFSGGKDSCVLSALIDLALPGNKIPRVYANTGIELNMIRDFVRSLAEKDDRIKIIKPKVPIKKMLEADGYPFKSKIHAKFVDRYQRIGKCDSVIQYLGERTDKEPWSPRMSCPSRLKYQFTDAFTMKISDKCCVRLKEEPLDLWRKENGKQYAITGVMRAEGGAKSERTVLNFRLW